MTEDETPRLSIFGWCQTQGKPDHYHTLCRVEYRSPFGVLHRCSCPNHDATEGAN